MPPKPYHITNCGAVLPWDGSLDSDPRGFAWLWEPPRPQERYVLGLDPTMGIAGWSRQLRTQNDRYTDNAAIEIIRVGRLGKPDMQVAEYAAPVDPWEIARLANVLGRLYGGNDDNGQALAIIEVWPGPGAPVLREMLRMDYTSQYVWKYGVDSAVMRTTGALGWSSNTKSVQYLWSLGARHITQGKIELRSPALIEEMAEAVPDRVLSRARAEKSGSHDDRITALLLAVWAAHDWSYAVEQERAHEVTNTPQPEWQASDMSLDSMEQAWSERFEQLLGE